MASNLRDILSKSQGERALGRVAASYHRIPYVMVGSITRTSGGGTFTFNNVDFFNDTGFVFEAHGMEFDDQLFNSSPPSAGFPLVRFSDVTRDILVTNPGSNTGGSYGTTFGSPTFGLVDLVGTSAWSGSGAGSIANGQDILRWEGKRWQFRYPYLIPPTCRLSAQSQINVANAIGGGLTVSIYGALLIPSDSEPFRGAAARLAASYLDRFIAPHEMERLRRTGGNERQTDRAVPAGDVLGYERVPFVFNTEIDVDSAGTPTEIAQQDMLNQTPYDFHIQDIALLMFDNELAFPNVTLRQVALRVIDADRNQEWNKEQQPFGPLVSYCSSVMRIGRGLGVCNATKYNLGPGTLLAPGMGLQAFANVVTGVNAARDVAVMYIGSLLVPIIRGTLFADCYEKFLRAVPVRY